MDTTVPTACVCCHRPLRTGETLGCRICREDGTRRLRALPGLYAASAAHLAPGRAGLGGGRVTGSKHAPMPVRADVLDVRGPGGVVAVLAQWEDVVRAELGFDPAPDGGSYEWVLAGAVGLLVDNAPWVYGQFAAVEELHAEVQAWHGRLTRLVHGDDRERRLTLECRCGAPLGGVTLSTPGRRCAACGAQYGWTELRGLLLAERSAASALRQSA